MGKGSYSDKILDILVRRGLIDDQKLQKAIEACGKGTKELTAHLVHEGLVSDTDMVLATSEYLGLRPMGLSNFTPDGKLLDMIPKEKLLAGMILPVASAGKMLTLAVSDPFNMGVIDEVETLTGMAVVPVVASEREVKDVLQKCFAQSSPDLEDILKKFADEDDVEVGREQSEDMSLDQMLESAEGAPVIRIVNSMLVEAIRMGASDIHIEPMEKILRLRYRVDGDMMEFTSPPKNLQAAIISRVKIMSDMNIAERRIPQDGRIKVRAIGKEVDIRVNLLPMIHGEKVVMRLLDKSGLAPNLPALGLDARALEGLRKAISQPHGIILVTGPTGSGKSTTLSSCLMELNRPEINIVTTEDPVEYQLPGVNQVQINEHIGLTFANALRAILRQDPDVIMVGEIRDGETAGIAVKAALTGHLVLSTLHTNDAASAIVRLDDMGVENFLIASSLIMTQAQRLFKKLCQACKQPVEISPEILRINDIDPKKFEGKTVFGPKTDGCPKCIKGFKGRGSLMEILLVSENIRQLILKGADSSAITGKAVENGMMTLRMVGLEIVINGVSSLEEVLRVTGSGE